MKVINLTPHKIVVANQKWSAGCGISMSDTANWPEVRVEYPASGEVVRLDFESHEEGKLDGFSISQQVLVGHNLPDPVEGTYLLISAMVLAEARVMGRTDCLAPDTSNAKRNEKGHIISVPGFVS